MSDELDEIKRELEEVRRLKESLKEELDEVRESKSELKHQERELRREAERMRNERPPRPPRPSKVKPVPPVRIDLTGLTDRLDTEMERIGTELEKSFKGLEDVFDVPGLFLKAGKRSKKRDREIEKIQPERVAKVISPLGSEERLRILNYLKDGPKQFKDLELHTGKTGSSLTHHLDPLMEAGYVIKGEVRGEYYVTVEGRLAYRLAQWITSKVEDEVVRRNGKAKITHKKGPKSESVTIRFDNDVDEPDEVEELRDQLNDELDEVDDLEDELDDHLDDIEEDDD